MKITYIGHSGFQVDWEDCVWVFDYYKGKLPFVPEGRKRIFFVSHKHGDHFNPEIFASGREEDWYLLDRETNHQVEKLHLPQKQMDRVLFVRPDQELYPWQGEMMVKTLHSTDCGVAFLVQYRGQTVYHAGDLNWWGWEGETKQQHNDMTARFRKEMEKLKEYHIQAAFLPLDPRQGERSHQGMLYFLEQVGAEWVFPMHLWGDMQWIEKTKNLKEMEPFRKKIISLKEKGQGFYVEET